MHSMYEIDPSEPVEVSTDTLAMLLLVTQTFYDMVHKDAPSCECEEHSTMQLFGEDENGFEYNLTVEGKRAIEFLRQLLKEPEELEEPERLEGAS